MIDREVTRVDFDSRHAKQRRLAVHSLVRSVINLADRDASFAPDSSPEELPFAQTTDANISATLYEIGYEAEARHLDNLCLVRANRGDTISDIHAMALAYARNVDDKIDYYIEIYAPKKHKPVGVYLVK